MEHTIRQVNVDGSTTLKIKTKTKLVVQRFDSSPAYYCLTKNSIIMTKEEFKTLKVGDYTTYTEYDLAKKMDRIHIGIVTRIEDEIVLVSNLKTHKAGEMSHYSHIELLHW